MNLQEYVPAALTTESRIDNVTVDITKLTLVVDMFIHAGNLLDIIKKNAFYGRAIDVNDWNNRVFALQSLSSSVDCMLTSEQTDLRTSDILPIDPRVFHAIIGIATESTELVEALASAVAGIKPLDPVNLREEGLQDTCWYQAILADAIGADWEQNLDINIAKLDARNKGKKFNAEATINRDVEAERKILEGAK